MFWGECNQRICEDIELSYQRLRAIFFQIPCGVVQIVARFGDPLSPEFFGDYLLWLVFLFSRFLLSFLVLGLFFLCMLPVYIGYVPFF